MAIRVLKNMKILNGVKQKFTCAKFSDCKNSRLIDVFASKPANSQMIIKGWVKAVRKMKDNIFIDVNDGSCSKRLQIIIPKSKKPKDIGFGAAIKAVGQLETSSSGQLELKADDVTVIGPCEVTDGYPFNPRTVHPPEYIRQFLHLRPRTNSFSSLLRVRDAATQAFHDYFHREGFIGIHTPILTSNDCEGAGEVFTVRPENRNLIRTMSKQELPQDEAYFDSKTFLTVSGQLHLEAVVRGISNVYTFGPTFRAENSRSRLHLSEFYMIEAEVAFIERMEDLLMLIERLIRGVTSKILDTCEDDVKKLQDSNRKDCLLKLVDRPFNIMTYDEAFDLVNNHAKNFTVQPRKEDGLAKEHELFLVKYNEDQPVFIVDWPKDMKPFYMKQTADSSKVFAVDLLTPLVGEVCGGSLREDNLSLLTQKLVHLDLDKSLDWYLELRKFGNVPSGGFGMGFERYLQFLLGIGNIKDTIPFPRWPHNCKL